MRGKKKGGINFSIEKSDPIHVLNITVFHPYFYEKRVEILNYETMNKSYNRSGEEKGGCTKSGVSMHILKITEFHHLFKYLFAKKGLQIPNLNRGNQNL